MKPNLLAGLLQDNERRSLTGFPGLLRLPVIKQLFSANDDHHRADRHRDADDAAHHPLARADTDRRRSAVHRHDGEPRHRWAAAAHRAAARGRSTGRTGQRSGSGRSTRSWPGASSTRCATARARRPRTGTARSRRTRATASGSAATDAAASAAAAVKRHPPRGDATRCSSRSASDDGLHGVAADRIADRCTRVRWRRGTQIVVDPEHARHACR